MSTFGTFCSSMALIPRQALPKVQSSHCDPDKIYETRHVTCDTCEIWMVTNTTWENQLKQKEASIELWVLSSRLVQQLTAWTVRCKTTVCKAHNYTTYNISMGIAEKSPHQEFEGNMMTVSAVLTLWELLTKGQTVTFIINNTAELPPTTHGAHNLSLV